MALQRAEIFYVDLSRSEGDFEFVQIEWGCTVVVIVRVTLISGNGHICLNFFGFRFDR